MKCKKCYEKMEKKYKVYLTKLELHFIRTKTEAVDTGEQELDQEINKLNEKCQIVLDAIEKEE